MRIIVALLMANGGRVQIECRVPGCTWPSPCHLSKFTAERQRAGHINWHRALNAITTSKENT